MNESLLDLAYRILSNRHLKKKKKDEIEAMPFLTLWEEVVLESNRAPEETENLIGEFYTNLILDQRFVSRGDNTWDLREFYTFDEVNENQDFYRDDDDADAEESATKDVLDFDNLDEDDIIINEDDETDAELRLNEVADIDY